MTTQTIAIVIGISYYLQEYIPSLPAAEIDAVNFSRALKNWGIPETNIFLFLNSEANEDAIISLLDKISKNKGPYKLVFYFCGHGHRILNILPTSYLILYNSYFENDQYVNSFNLDCFLERISKMNAVESYILIDACRLRVNSFINPKLVEEIKGEPSSHKKLFCLFSSGIEDSFENIHGQYGYFTRALLNGLCRIRKNEGSPTQFLYDIQNELKEQNLPLPDMINFDNQKISFTPSDNFFLDSCGQVYRAKLICEIQDAIIQNPDKNIVIVGDGGSGKTTICKWLASEKMKTICLTIPVNQNTSFDPMVFLERELYERFGLNFDKFNDRCSFFFIIIDQIERLDVNQQDLFFKKISILKNLKFLCALKGPIKNPEISTLFFTLFIPPLSLDEGRLLIKKIRPDFFEEEIELLYLSSLGIPAKIKNPIFSEKQLKNIDLKEFKKIIAAASSCDFYFDKFLFKQVFNLQGELLDFFETFGLILSSKQGFFLHPFLNEFAKLKSLTADLQMALNYWDQQIKALPIHQQAAKSFIHAVKRSGYKKEIEKSLKKAFQCLTVNQENLDYFISGAEIFLPLSYQTATSSYVEKALRKLGNFELANELLKKRKSTIKQFFYITFLIFFVMTPFYFVFWPHQHAYPIAYIKQTHPDFVGREKYMDLLEKKIITDRNSNVNPVVVLWGEGGIGKSELAIAFANRYLKHFDLIHWIDAATDESYLASYQHLATHLKIPFQQQESINTLSRKVHSHLENENQLVWLLIYDNVEKEYELPQRGTGSVIITTRDHAIWHLYPHYEMTPFTDEEALLVFEKITLKKKNPCLVSLIQELGNYPLSINLAAHYMAETPWISEETYIRLFSKNEVDILNIMPTNDRYRNNLLKSWQITAEQMHKNHPKALNWLHFCSYLHPDLIPSSWVKEWLIQFSEGKLNPYSAEIEANDILRLIVNQSLMRYDKNKKSLSLHRLKQEIFKQDDYFDRKIQEKVLNLLVHDLEKFERADEMERNSYLWPKLSEWEFHAVWFLDKYSETSSKTEIALLNNLVGSWKIIKGEYELAESYIDKALKLRIELFGENDLRTIISLNNKGWVLMELDKFEEAKSIYQKALMSLEKTAGDEHEYKSILMNNISLIFMELKEYELMKSFNEEVLQKRLKKYGTNNTYTADSMHNLAIAYAKLNEYDQAVNYFEQSLDSFKSVHGENHPYRAITMDYLARTLAAQGKHHRAEMFYVQAINLYIKLYGKEHPYLAHCLQHMGRLLKKEKRDREAMDLFKDALTIFSKIYTSDHPHMSSILEDFRDLSETCKNAEIIKEIEILIKNLQT